MTDEELEKKAKYYTDSHDTELEGMEEILDCSRQVKEAYIAGARENGSVWHGLRKDPNDLPSKSGPYWCHYNSYTEDSLYYEAVNKHWYASTKVPDVIAWCEIPKYEEK